MGKGWRTPSWSTAAEADEPAWSAANDHDGQTRNATSANGWSSAGASSAELQVHTNCSQPASSGDARPDGGSRRCSSSTAGSACPGPGRLQRGGDHLLLLLHLWHLLRFWHLLLLWLLLLLLLVGFLLLWLFLLGLLLLLLLAVSVLDRLGIAIGFGLWGFCNLLNFLRFFLFGSNICS